VWREGPLAGGPLGFSLDQLTAYGADTGDVPATYDQAAYDEEVKAIIKVVGEYGDKYGRHIPVVTAGGIYTHEDVLHQLELGADGGPGGPQCGHQVCHHQGVRCIRSI